MDTGTRTSSLPKVGTWAVAHTKARSEKVLESFFRSHGVRCWLPVVAKRRVYGTRIRESKLPLFPGYVFFDRDAIPRERVFDSRKVAGVLYPVEPDRLRTDLENLARVLAAGPEVKKVPRPEPGTPVEVVSGPMQGVRGEVVRHANGASLVVRIHFLAEAAELQIDEAFVRPEA